MSPLAASSARDYAQRDEPETGEFETHGDVGSTGSLDAVNTDTNKDEATRAFGFLGKSSVATWVQRAAQEADTVGAESGGFAPPSKEDKIPLTQATYHTTDADTKESEQGSVTATAWPTPSTAHLLVTSYFATTHDVFPVINKKEFLSRFRTFPREQQPVHELNADDKAWLCTLNAVLAIGAKHAQLVKAGHAADERDHGLYYRRAKMLGLGTQLLFTDAELKQTVCLALCALYLTANNQVNRLVVIRCLAALRLC